MLSLCKRGGMLVSGEAGCEKAIKGGSGDAKAILLSYEASKNTRKKFTNSAKYYKIPIYIVKFDKEVLGKTIG